MKKNHVIETEDCLGVYRRTIASSTANGGKEIYVDTDVTIGGLSAVLVVVEKSNKAYTAREVYRGNEIAVAVKRYNEILG